MTGIQSLGRLLDGCQFKFPPKTPKQCDRPTDRPATTEPTGLHERMSPTQR